MDMREAIAAQTSFSLRLSSHLLSLNGSAGFNLAFSPLSLHSVLSLLTAGSSGPTHQQLLWFLGCPLASNLVALYFQISNSILVDGSAVGGPCICYAGGVWVDAGVNLKNSFREVAGSVYKAEAHSVPFRALERKMPVWNFRIPKFKISTGIDFSEILKNLGLVLPFGVTGDLSEMVDSLEYRKYYVSHIARKCFVEVNEDGTEAAAASGVVTELQCARQPIDFVADHPFLFLILEDRSGVVLFMGHFLNPLLAG